MCTDSSRELIRVIAGSAYGLTREHIIGFEVNIESIRGWLVRTATPIPLDDGPGKTVHLWDAPVLNRCSPQATQQVTSRCFGQHSFASWCTTMTASGSTRTRATQFSTRKGQRLDSSEHAEGLHTPVALRSTPRRPMTREVFDRHASATGDRAACKKDTAYRDTRRDNPLPGPCWRGPAGGRRICGLAAVLRGSRS